MKIDYLFDGRTLDAGHLKIGPVSIAARHVSGRVAHEGVPFVGLHSIDFHTPRARRISPHDGMQQRPDQALSFFSVILVIVLQTPSARGKVRLQYCPTLAGSSGLSRHFQLEYEQPGQVTTNLPACLLSGSVLACVFWISACIGLFCSGPWMEMGENDSPMKFESDL